MFRSRKTRREELVCCPFSSSISSIPSLAALSSVPGEAFLMASKNTIRSSASSSANITCTLVITRFKRARVANCSIQQHKKKQTATSALKALSLDQGYEAFHGHDGYPVCDALRKTQDTSLHSGFPRCA